MEIIDLTGAFESTIWRYEPTFPEFVAEPMTSHEEHGFVVSRVILSTHMGTHTDALGHLVVDGPMLDAVPLSRFVGEAQVFDLPREALAPIDASDLAGAAGELKPGDIALIRTGWDAHWQRPDYALAHPFLTLGAAEWLIGQGVKCVGMDTAGLMDPRIDLAPGRRAPGDVVDEVLMRAGVSYVAALVNLGSLSQSRVLFVALPLKLGNLDGAPVRAVAVQDARLVRMPQAGVTREEVLGE
jgi:kynurenine formamidase